MADIKFGDLVTMIIHQLADSIEQTVERAEEARLHVSDVDLEIPALVRLEADETAAAAPPQLMVNLPTTRETPPPGRVGRVRITFEALPPLPPEESP